MFNRLGVLVNIGRFYLYQPVELVDNKSISIYDRTHPVAFKRQSLTYKLPDKIKSMNLGRKKGDDNDGETKEVDSKFLINLNIIKIWVHQCNR